MGLANGCCFKNIRSKNVKSASQFPASCAHFLQSPELWFLLLQARTTIPLHLPYSNLSDSMRSNLNQEKLKTYENILFFCKSSETTSTQLPAVRQSPSCHLISQAERRLRHSKPWPSGMGQRGAPQSLPL